MKFSQEVPGRRGDRQKQSHRSRWLLSSYLHGREATTNTCGKNPVETKYPDLRDPGPKGAVCRPLPARAIETGADYRLGHTDPRISHGSVVQGTTLRAPLRSIALGREAGSWYVLEHRVLDAHGRVALDLGRSDWADWSRSGELLVAREGRLYRVVVDGKSGPGTPEELIDLRDLKFEPSTVPPQATMWKGRSPRGQVLIR
jgi:hypothetical protein